MHKVEVCRYHEIMVKYRDVPMDNWSLSGRDKTQNYYLLFSYNLRICTQQTPYCIDLMILKKVESFETSKQQIFRILDTKYNNKTMDVLVGELQKKRNTSEHYY